jgi:hypothetical protein
LKAIGKFQYITLKARYTVGRAHEPADQVAVLKKFVIDKHFFGKAPLKL